MNIHAYKLYANTNNINSTSRNLFLFLAFTFVLSVSKFFLFFCHQRLIVLELLQDCLVLNTQGYVCTKFFEMVLNNKSRWGNSVARRIHVGQGVDPAIVVVRLFDSGSGFTFKNVKLSLIDVPVLQSQPRLEVFKGGETPRQSTAAVEPYNLRLV